MGQIFTTRTQRIELGRYYNATQRFIWRILVHGRIRKEGCANARVNSGPGPNLDLVLVLILDLVLVLILDLVLVLVLGPGPGLWSDPRPGPGPRVEWLACFALDSVRALGGVEPNQP